MSRPIRIHKNQNGHYLCNHAVKVTPEKITCNDKKVTCGNCLFRMKNKKKMSNKEITWRFLGLLCGGFMVGFAFDMSLFKFVVGLTGLGIILLLWHRGRY